MHEFFKLDDENNVVECEEGMEGWILWCRDNEDKKFVSQTEVANLLVSTVFLSTPIRIFGKPSRFFETMVFRSPEFIQDEMFPVERYSTHKEAEKGHDEMVAYVRAAVEKEEG
jgi:hypothetical protein